MDEWTKFLTWVNSGLTDAVIEDAIIRLETSLLPQHIRYIGALSGAERAHYEETIQMLWDQLAVLRMMLDDRKAVHRGHR